MKNVLKALAETTHNVPAGIDPGIAEAIAVSKSKATPAVKGKKHKKNGEAAHDKVATLVISRMPKVPAWVMTDDAKACLKAVGVVIRKSADNTFAIGEVLYTAQQVIPEKSWAKAIKPLGLTVKTAYNFMSVYRMLSAYRAVLVEADIGQTVMYQLARAPRLVELVVEAYGRGERISVAGVRRLVDEALGVKPKPVVDMFNLGGLSGLRRAAAAKDRADIAEFVRLIKVILSLVEEAMKPIIEGKRVKKGPLATAIVYECRHACDLVNAIVAPLDATARHLSLAPHKLPADSGWGKVQALLTQLGNEPTWPAADGLESWLVNDVVPMLRFVALGEVVPSAAGSVELTSAADAMVVGDADVATFADIGDTEAEIENAATAVAGEARIEVTVPPLAAEESVTVPISLELEAPAELEQLG